MIVRIPGSGAHALDQLRRHAIAFNRERVIGIALVDIIDKAQISLPVPRLARRIGKDRQHRLAKRFPQKVQARYDRARRTPDGTKRLGSGANGSFSRTS